MLRNNNLGEQSYQKDWSTILLEIASELILRENIKSTISGYSRNIRFFLSKKKKAINSNHLISLRMINRLDQDAKLFRPVSMIKWFLSLSRAIISSFARTDRERKREQPRKLSTRFQPTSIHRSFPSSRGEKRRGEKGSLSWGLKFRDLSRFHSLENVRRKRLLRSSVPGPRKILLRYQSE